MTKDVVSLLDKDDVQEILNSKHKNKRTQIVSYSIKSFGGGVTGFLGDHLSLVVHYKVDGTEIEKKFFIKAGSTEQGTQQYEYTVRSGIFVREIDIYKRILHDVAEIMKVKGIYEEWFPQFYFEKENRILVVDDISTKGYAVVPNRQDLNYEHVLVALRAIAHMHASFIWYERNITQETGKKLVPDIFPCLGKEGIYTTEDEENPFMKWFIKIAPSYESLVDYLDGYDASQVSKIKPALTRAMLDMSTMVKPSKKYLNVVNHGDLWSNNIMFKYEGSHPINATLVDYQLARYGPPAEDVMMFIYQTTVKELRQKHEAEFKEYYYKHLKMYLKKYNVDSDMISEEEFLESCEDYRQLGLLKALQTLSYILTPGHITDDAWSSSEKYQDFITDRREFYMKKCYEDQLYKERNSELLIELIDSYLL